MTIAVDMGRKATKTNKQTNKQTRDLKIINDSRIRSIICKGPKYRFPVPIDFKSCRDEITGALQEFCNRCCKREHVESNALNSWKLNIFEITDGRMERAGCFAWFVFLMSRGGCAALPRNATGLSVVCDCGIS